MLSKYPRRDAAYIATAKGVSVVDRQQPRLVDLDSFSTHIWLGIDGRRALRDIADLIAGRHDQPTEGIRAMAEQKCYELVEAGLVTMADEPAPLPYHVSLPRDQLDRDKMTDSMREAGWIR